MNDGKYWDIAWNPVTGCSPQGVGCSNCWARSMAKRFWKDRRFGDVRFHRDRLNNPKHWKKPRTIAVSWMGDLFHERVAYEWLSPIFDVMAESPQHTFLVLTKRAERCRDVLTRHIECSTNVWVGCSVSNQPEAEDLVPYILDIPNVVHWLSIEPMIGPVSLASLPCNVRPLSPTSRLHRDYFCALRGAGYDSQRDEYTDNWQYPSLDLVVVGGETGPGARPMPRDAAYGILRECRNSGTPFFFKSWGDYEALEDGSYRRWPRGHKALRGRILDGRTFDQWPDGKIRCWKPGPDLACIVRRPPGVVCGGRR